MLLNVLEMVTVLVLSAGIGTLLLLMGTQEKLLQEKRSGYINVYEK